MATQMNEKTIPNLLLYHILTKMSNLYVGHCARAQRVR